MEQSKYWSYREAHKQTGLALGTLYALVHFKQVPHVRLGRRHVLFPVSELLAWIEQHRVQDCAVMDAEKQNPSHGGLE